MRKDDEMTIEEALEKIKTRPVVSPWPAVGVVLELSKGGTYEAIRRGDFETMRVGKSIKVFTAPLRKKLGI